VKELKENCIWDYFFHDTFFSEHNKWFAAEKWRVDIL
jgi:hypothetical protein